jgi:ABC-type transport system involved in cytochrome c biogenesis permease component
VIVFFDARLVDPAVVALALALGLVGQAALGTLCSALLVQVRLREVLLPLLLYPLLAPVLIAGVQATLLTQSGAGREAAGGWLALMAGIDAVAVIVAPWLHGKVARP